MSDGTVALDIYFDKLYKYKNLPVFFDKILWVFTTLFKVNSSQRNYSDEKTSCNITIMKSSKFFLTKHFYNFIWSNSSPRNYSEEKTFCNITIMKISSFFWKNTLQLYLSSINNIIIILGYIYINNNKCLVPWFYDHT